MRSFGPLLGPVGVGMFIFHVSEKSILPRVHFVSITQITRKPDQIVNRALVSLQIPRPRELNVAWLATPRIGTITTIS